MENLESLPDPTKAVGKLARISRGATHRVSQFHPEHQVGDVVKITAVTRRLNTGRTWFAIETLDGTPIKTMMFAGSDNVKPYYGARGTHLEFLSG
jgi:hypothetical protein